MRDGPDPPPIIIGSDSVEFAIYLSYIWIQKFPTPAINRRDNLAAGVMRDLWRSLWW